jgi:uncharacterized protein
MVNIRQKDRPKAGIYSNYKKARNKPVIYLAVLLLVMFIMTVVYNPKGKQKRMSENRDNPAASTSTEPVFVKNGELTFLKADSTAITAIDIEIADDDLKRERGLMFRRQMELNHGMLFIFAEEELRSFWMKNTYLPLDILYLNAQRKIIRIHENVATLNERSVPSEMPAKYVVEVNAGFCALYGIQLGDWISFIRK